MLKKVVIPYLIIIFILIYPSISIYPKVYGTSVNDKNIVVIRMESTIDMGMADILSRTIKSLPPNTEAVIIVLNTNGGYLEATEDIVDTIMNSLVKVIVYVPVGGRAFSAGAYIAVSSNELVMSPGSVIGSAEPRSIGGMKEDPKVINAMAGWIGSIASYRGRNSTAARLMVTKNKDYTPGEAVKYGVANYIVKDFNELLSKERFKGASIIEVKPDIRSKFLSIISDPFIVGLLLEIASLLILIEIFHPTYLGGFAGGAAFILALLGLGMIGADITAAILLFLGIIAILLEVKLGHGGSAVAGAFLIIFGILLLYRREYFIWTVSYTSLFAGGLTALIVIASIVGFYLHKIREVVKRKRSILDINQLIGKRGIVKSKIEPNKPGVVLVMSDYWTAYSDEVIEEGEEVIVIKVEGLKVYVKKVGKS